MTEIRIDVDLPHPPERVWRALTDPPVINSWFPNTGFVATEDGRFTIRPAGIGGLDGPIDGEIVSAESRRRLVLRLEAPRLHTVLTVTLHPTGTGCRLRLTQRGFLGPQGTMRRRVLQRAYTELIEVRLAAALRRLADTPADPPDVDSPVREPKRNTAGPFLRVPKQPPSGRGEQPPRSASAPGLASHVRAPVGPPGVPRVPGFGAAVLGARAVPRPVGVVRADEVARLAEAAAIGADPDPAAADPDPAGGTHGPAGAGGSHGPGSGVGSDAAGSGAPPPPRHRSPSSGSPAIWLSDGLVRLGSAIRALSRWLVGVPQWSAERRSQAVAALAALLLLIALVALLLAKATTPRPAGPPQVGGGQRQPGEANVPAQQRGPSSGRSTGPQATPAGPPSGVTGTPSRPGGSAAVPVPLAGTYRTERGYVSGYEASVTITNPSDAPVLGWEVSLRMPLLTLIVHGVEGGTLTQTGMNVTFTPVESTQTIPPGGSVTVRFQVEGVGTPSSCTVGARPCAGIPE